MLDGTGVSVGVWDLVGVRVSPGVSLVGSVCEGDGVNVCVGNGVIVLVGIGVDVGTRVHLGVIVGVGVGT